MGSETVHALWDGVPEAQMASTFGVYAETYSIMIRKRNRGALSAALFQEAKSLPRLDLVNSLDFVLLVTDTVDILASIDLMERHAINSSDAAFLAVCLRYHSIINEPCVVAASDTRLLRAAFAEGLPVINPEQTGAAIALDLFAAL